MLVGRKMKLSEYLKDAVPAALAAAAGDPAKIAEVEARRALELDPEEPNRYSDLAVALLRWGRRRGSPA